ncbi:MULTISPECIES: NUDIX domain-containing protein [Methylomonas]|uniref:ADP-ribose pyrophosphatase n=2 Tax=Methylomonas TaxID=416 RepID=A0A126T816_9GAMM|nr:MULTISPECIES: NUDIX domain-containing protein [Methylomonas]AMK77904.1 ADP-ribose pyrophosphatase [Methylomonas denitrificans]OAI04563.1 ADP-ribose pyrophosphatase [Methylomonas methanica]TCV87076.1 ADP-ribose pyrophosphatase [Methylomonas methanica]
MSDKQFQVLDTQLVYEGFFRLEQYTLTHTLFAGGWSQPLKRELFRRGNCVAVLLYDPNRDEVVLIEQFRVGAVLQPERAWLLEIVAGAIEDGETAEEVAYREAREEAGCEIQELIEIKQFFTTPGGSSEWITLFCGRVDSSQVGGIHGLDEEDEDIRVTAVKFDEVFQMLEDDKIESGIPIIAIQWLYIHREKLRNLWLAEA